MAGMFDSGAGLNAGMGLGVAPMPGAAFPASNGPNFDLSSSPTPASHLSLADTRLLDGAGNVLPPDTQGAGLFNYLEAGGSLAGGAASIAKGIPNRAAIQGDGGSVSSHSPASLKGPTSQLTIGTSAYPTQPNSPHDPLPRVPPEYTQHLADILNKIANIKM